MHRTHQEWTSDLASGETLQLVFLDPEHVELSKDLLSNKNGTWLAGISTMNEIMNNEDVVSYIETQWIFFSLLS